MIVEYNPETDDFQLWGDVDMILNAHEMKELIETAQLAVAERFQIKGEMTV